jgi:hypothetical protein
VLDAVRRGVHRVDARQGNGVTGVTNVTIVRGCTSRCECASPYPSRRPPSRSAV